jgi:hypothetical protein
MDTDISMDPAAGAGSHRWCHYHRGPSQTARLVRVIKSESGGPGGGLYACAPCREQRGLTPVADIPVADLVAEVADEIAIRRTP